MKTVILIPSRFASSRYPGKPLAMIEGASGISRSLIHRSWLAASSVEDVAAVHVVTDDQRIADAAGRFGADVIMTPASCENGTARCAAALTAASLECDLVVNFQGDAPLTPPWFVSDLMAAMKEPNADVATPVLRCEPQTLRHLIEDRQAGRVGGTTCVFDANADALYFSKEVIPFAGGWNGKEQTDVFHHVGVYAYRPDALEAYARMPSRRLEAIEGLEQLRFLENGMPIRTVEVDARGRVFWELNNPADLPRIEAAMRQMEIE